MNEATLEQYVIELIEKQGYTHTQGEALDRTHEDVLIKADLISYLTQAYKAHALTQNEAERVFNELSALGDSTSKGTLYEQNKKLCGWLSKGVRCSSSLSESVVIKRAARVSASRASRHALG